MNADFHKLAKALLGAVFMLPVCVLADKPLGEKIKSIELELDKEKNSLGISITWAEKPNELFLLVSEEPIARDPMDSARIFCSLGAVESDDPFASVSASSHKRDWVTFLVLTNTKKETVFFIVDKREVTLLELLDSYPVKEVPRF